MKLSSGLIIAIIFLAFFTIRSIYNITVSIKNKEIETKYGKSRINKDKSIIYDEVVFDNEKYKRGKKSRTYSRRRGIDSKDEKYLEAKKYSDKIKVTSLIGWIIAIIFLIIYYIKSNKF